MVTFPLLFYFKISSYNRPLYFVFLCLLGPWTSVNRLNPLILITYNSKRLTRYEKL